MCCAVWHAIHARHKIEVFANSEIFPERKPLGHVADFALDRCRLPNHVKTHHAAATAIGFQKAADQTDGSGFSAAIWTEKAEDFPTLHFERKIAHDALVAIALV